MVLHELYLRRKEENKPVKPQKKRKETAVTPRMATMTTFPLFYPMCLAATGSRNRKRLLL